MIRKETGKPPTTHPLPTKMKLAIQYNNSASDETGGFMYIDIEEAYEIYAALHKVFRGDPEHVAPYPLQK